MTEHSKIPLPGSPGSSLLERASGAFGFDPFLPPPVAAPAAGPGPAGRQPAESARLPNDLPRASKPGSAAPEPRAKWPLTRAPDRSGSAAGPVRLGGAPHPIDRARLAENAIIVPEAGATALLEEFRIVKRQLRAAAQATDDPAARRVLVCSPHPDEGKTFCALNLAIAMAGERGGEVLLVDADFAKPSVPAMLGLPSGPGLMDALADPAIRVEDLVIATDIAGFYVLPAGQQTAADSEWLASERTAEVLDRLTRDAPARMVVFDSPPALSASSAAELAKHVGQAVLIARADRTGRAALEDAVKLLGACPDIKLLLNAAHFSPSGRKFGTYYGREGEAP